MSVLNTEGLFWLTALVTAVGAVWSLKRLGRKGALGFVGITFVLLLSTALGTSAIVQNTKLFLSICVGVLLISLCGAVFFGRKPISRTILLELHFFQLWRVPASALLLGVVFAQQFENLDWIAGLALPLLGWVHYHLKILNAKSLAMWNAVGILLALKLGWVAAHFELMRSVPFLWLLVFLLPLSIGVHVVMLMQLRLEKNQQTESAA